MKKLLMFQMLLICAFLSNISCGSYWPDSYDGNEIILKNTLAKTNERTYSIYLTAAENGNKDAQYIIGGLYLKGTGVSQDTSKAIGWLTMAAEANQLDAQQLLAKLYFLGDLVEKNDVLAYKWLAILGARNLWLRTLMNECKIQIDPADVELGQKMAQIWLDQWYAKCMQDSNCTFEAFEDTIGIKSFYPGNGSGRKKTQTGIKNNPFQLGDYYGDVRRNFGENEINKVAMKAHSDEKKQVDALLTLATAGDINSQTRAGVCFFYGTGYREDNLKSLKWFRIAAENGDADALFCLGRMHLIGIGTVQNPTKAIELLTKAAKKNQVDAMYLLAKAYFEGDVLKKNDVESYKWLFIMANYDKKAADIVKKCEKIMSNYDVEQGQKLANEWLKN